MRHVRSPIWQLTSLIVTLALVLGFAGVPARAAIPSTLFELDGNALDSPAGSPDDWSTLYNNGGNNGGARPPLAAFSGIVPDPAPQTIFTGGGSKDDLDITSWRHTNGSVPDKDDITNAYAAGYINSNNELILVFGADRYATNGNAALGFWFFQEDVAPLAAGTFSGKHVEGDVLVLSEFTNGGSQPTIQVYRWKPGGPINGTLELLTDVSSACNTAAGLASNACAIVNSSSAAAPWPYTPKSGPAGSFGRGAFFEGAVNLSALFAGQTPCITSFMAETRSSQSVDATLKDFDSGDFNLCGATIAIGPNAVNAVGDPHSFTVTINQTFGGVSLPAPNGTVATVTLTHSAGATVTKSTDTCASPGTVNGTCTVTFTTNTAGTVTGHAEATVTVGNSSQTVQTGTSTTNPDAVKYFVNASIAIAPSAVNSVGQQHVFTITANAIKTAGVSVTGYSITPSVSPAPGSQSSTCGSGLGTGDTATCTVTINSNTPGTFTANATVVVSYSIANGNPSTASVTRSTSGNSGPGGSGAATKEFRAGSISLTKTVELGKFTAAPNVCYTLSQTAGTTITPLTTSANPQCFQYSAGTTSHVFTWAGLASGTYSLAESVTPSPPYTANADITGIIVDATGSNPNVNAGTATNPLPPGSLRIAKTVNGGAVPAGAQFDFAVFACTGATIATCNTTTPVATTKVPDGGGNQPVAVGNLQEGYYLVRETGAPAGYQIDPATQDQITQVFAGNVGGPLTVTFNNLRLFRLIVLTCSMQNELVVSEVNLDGTLKDTLSAPPAGISAEQLCTLGGANYADLEEGTYTPSVELPKQP